MILLPHRTPGDELVGVDKLLPEKSILCRMRGDMGGSYGVSRERLGATCARAVIPARCDNANAGFVKTVPHGAFWIQIGIR